MSSDTAVMGGYGITSGVASFLTCPPVFPHWSPQGKGCRVMSLCDCALPALGWCKGMCPE